jgi:hypothetical protein
MLQWQVPVFFPFVRALSVAKRTRAPARRPHRRPFPELTDGSGSDPQGNFKRTQLEKEATRVVSQAPEQKQGKRESSR